MRALLAPCLLALLALLEVPLRPAAAEKFTVNGRVDESGNMKANIGAINGADVYALGAITAQKEGKDVDEYIEELRVGMPFLDKWLKTATEAEKARAVHEGHGRVYANPDYDPDAPKADNDAGLSVHADGSKVGNVDLGSEVKADLTSGHSSETKGKGKAKRKFKKGRGARRDQDGVPDEL